MSTVAAQPPPASVAARPGAAGASGGPVPVPVPVGGGRPAGPPARRGDRRAVLRAYVALTKPRIVELLLITALPTMLVAAGGWPPLGLTVVVLVGGALAAGAANSLNCYLDRDIDRVMRRTARRPLPADALRPRSVLAFGLVLGAVSVTLLLAFTNVLAAALTLAAIAYYDLVYTRWLKRTTWQNTVWGGACGAAPVLIGWAAVTGSLDATAWLLFAVVFLWQPPHFYALAVKFRDDYTRAGIPMLPVVASARRVAGESLLFCWLTVAASVALWPVALSPLYGICALVLGAVLLREAHRMYRRAASGAPLQPMRLFRWSTSYLTLLFLAIAVDALVVA